MKKTAKAAMSPMEMDVRIFPNRGDGSATAFAAVTLNGCFAIRDIRIMEGKNRCFIAMPSRKVKGEYRDICFPCTKEFRQQFDQKILNAYQQSLTQGKQRQEQETSPQPEPEEPSPPEQDEEPQESEPGMRMEM